MLAPDLLSLTALAGPFPSFAAWCQKSADPARCQQLREPLAGIAAIVAVEQPDPLVAVALKTDAGWYVGSAPGSTAPGSIGLELAYEQ